jgi:hypothetical protein
MDKDQGRLFFTSYTGQKIQFGTWPDPDPQSCVCFYYYISFVYEQVRHMQDEEMLDAEDFFDFQVSKEGGTVSSSPNGSCHHFSQRLWIRITWIRIRILLLIKEMEVCDHRTIEPPRLHFEPPGLLCELLRISTALFSL